MAYFSLPALTLPSYRFDYHSHFGGILPVENEAAVATDAVPLDITYQVQDQGVTVDTKVTVTVIKGQQLTLAGLFGGTLDEQQPERGALSLFLKALMLMEESNPLAALAASRNRSRYERGECIAEDIYIACVCLANQLKLDAVRDAAATDPVLYKTVRSALERLALAPPPGQPRPIEALMPLLRYFNDKIYSASKYTPFDDAYRMRSFAMKKLRAEVGGEERYLQWIAMSLRYLEQEGIAHAQLAMGEDEVRVANAVLSAYNKARKTCYKLLAHTATVYAGDKALEYELTTKILPLFLDPSLNELIGIDLLGSENKVGNYTELFSFLNAQKNAQSAPLTQFFGDVDQSRALQLVSHIHCGEGMGVAADNRSAIGYAMAYSRHLPGPEFYRAYAQYVLACQTAAQGRRADNARGTAGTHAHKDNGVSGLFDEMFRNDSLTVDGLTLRRYDGNSVRTQELVAYAGKRNMMALCESLDQSPPAPAQAPAAPAQPPAAQAQSYYQLLTAPGTLLGFRLGHAYYYRSFVAARYPLIAFDTNLGSNSITGASGLFASAEGYRLNRGFRHLDGYVDTDLLTTVSDKVMFMGLHALSDSQVASLMTLARGSASLADLLQQGQATLSGLLNAALAPIAPKMDSAANYASFSALVTAMVGANTSPSVWFAALARVLNLFINWRSYLLGSDAQGVEHTNVQDEFLRCVLLLAYNVAPFDTSAQGAAEVGKQLQALVTTIAAAYWQTTVGPLAGNDSGPQTAAAIAGYKAPASVVTVTRAVLAQGASA